MGTWSNYRITGQRISECITKFPAIDSIRYQSPTHTCALAWSPLDFRDCGEVVNLIISNVPYTFTNCGIEIELPIITDFTSKMAGGGEEKSVSVDLLCCEYIGTYELLGILSTHSRKGKPLFDSLDLMIAKDRALQPFQLTQIKLPEQ
jgi:hypothetical protein